MIKEQTCLDLILGADDNGKAYFVGVKDLNTKRYISPITAELSLNEFSKLFLPTEENSMYRNINLIQLFDLYVNDIKNWITQENNRLFRTFVEYKQTGVLRSFKNDFSRIKDGELADASTLYTELEELLGFYKKELLSTKGKKYCQSSQKSNIDQVEDNFHALVTVLVMSIFVQFHRKDNKKYFAEDQLYSKDIVDIKQYLEGMINERVLRELLIQQVCIEKSLTLLNKNNIIRNQNISELGLYQELKFDHEWNGHNNRWSVICNVYEFDMKNNHHSRLLDLLNILNTIDFLYKGLIESCLKDDGSESVYTSKIVLLLKGKEDLSKLDTNLLIE